VTDYAIAPVRPGHTYWIVAINTFKTVDLKKVIVGIAVPCIAGERTVEPIRRVEGRTAAVTTHGVRRTGNTGNTTCKIIPMTIHAGGAIGGSI